MVKQLFKTYKSSDLKKSELFLSTLIMKHNDKLERKIKRQQMVESGAYDGRFKSKVVPDKKKKQSKNWARNNGDQAN